MFSVVIPTRNRSALLRAAVESVLQQDCTDYEVVIVDDGSNDDERAQYSSLAHTWKGRPIAFHALVHRPKGHGPAYSRNFGVSRSAGRFLCFLDDDDLWIDPRHLSRCRDSLVSRGESVDLYFTDQRAVYSNGRLHEGRLWISGMDQRCHGPQDALGNKVVDVDTLLEVSGFPHLNCSIYRREFYSAIGGMDETIRHEEDRDIYLRAIDAAATTLYNPAVIAQHHIPDATRADNVSTAVNRLEKALFQLRIFDKALIAARQPAVRSFARRSKGYTLKHIAHALAVAGRHQEAAYYMREALLVSFTFKWLAYTALGTVRAAFGRGMH
ncbi:MAG: glycosyltransferase family 2 protein [Rubrivivax sp.]|nr:glycosyltransferase family 2 protein [Rubrivivax sp.]